MLTSNATFHRQVAMTMGFQKRPPTRKFEPPEGAAEELAAAVEATTGEEYTPPFTDPIEPQNVFDTLNRLLLAERPDRGLEVLVRSSLMEQLLPEVADMVGFGEGIRHKDVWEHTKKVLGRTEKTPVLRFAALFHDIGKVPTRRFESGGQVTFLGHPEIGARMFEKLARRLKFPRDLAEQVRFLIAAHLRASAYDGTWTDSAVRRFAKEIGDALDDLLALSRADITSKYEEKVRRGIELIDSLGDRVAEIRALDAKPKPLPKGLGTAVSQHFDLSPGPGLGSLMRELMDLVEEGDLGIQQPYAHYIEYIEGHPGLLEKAKV